MVTGTCDDVHADGTWGHKHHEWQAGHIIMYLLVVLVDRNFTNGNLAM